MNRLITIALTIAVLFTGCAASGPKFSPAADLKSVEGVIYVYRPPRVGNSGSYPQVEVDGEVIGGLKNGGYLVRRVATGHHVVEQMYSALVWPLKAPAVKVDVRPGQSIYVRLLSDASVAGLVITRGLAFHEVDEVTGRREIEQLSLSE